MAHDDLSDFRADMFDHDGTSRRIFRKGTGPGVLIMSELPGITPHVADFARRVVDAGFTVAMPDIFGEAGRPMTFPYSLTTLAKLCVSKEFTLFATGRSSPITDWLRALGADLHERAGGPGIGAIGMCLTGGFALSLAVDDHLLAPVLSQPSLPSGSWGAKGIDISPAALDKVKQRCATEDLCVIGLRFNRDPVSPAARFTWLREQLGDAFVSIEIDPEHANPRGRPVPPHSVVTTDCIDEPGQPTHDALERVLDLFRDRLIVA